MWDNVSIGMTGMYLIRGTLEDVQASPGQMLAGKLCHLIFFCISLSFFLRLYEGSPRLGFWPQSKFFC